MPKGRAIFQLSLRQLALVAFIALNLAIPRETQAEWLAGAGTGLNICVPDRKANCRGYLPHAALDLSLGYRFKYVSITLDYDYGWLWPSGDDLTISLNHIMPVLRGMYEYKGIEWVGGVGVGYGSITGYDGKAKEEFFSWLNRFLNVRVLAAGYYPVADGFDVGGELNSFFHFGGRRCLTLAGSKDCADIADLKGRETRISETMQLKFVGRYTF